MGNVFYQAFIGTNSVRGSQGIYTLRIDAQTLAPEIVATRQTYNTGGVALSGDAKHLYAVAEGMTFEGWAEGGVSAFAVEDDGSLRPLGGQRSHGQRTCCVALDKQERHALCCNFYHGTWCAMPIKADGSLSPARLVVAPPEDSGWKALHCITALDEEHLGVISLAECALVAYRIDDGRRVASFPFPENPFPRYLAVQGNYIYAMMQFPDALYVLENQLAQSGKLVLRQTTTLLDEAHPSMPASSTLRVTPDGKWLLAANRPSNSLTLFAIQPDGTLVRENIIEIPGDGPRDFHLSRDGRIAVVAMQHSNQVQVMELDTANKTLHHRGTVSVPSPAAVAVTGRMEA
jgi:6-phosphogluconolactonase